MCTLWLRSLPPSTTKPRGSLLRRNSSTYATLRPSDAEVVLHVHIERGYIDMKLVMTIMTVMTSNHRYVMCIQWNLSKLDTLGWKSVLNSEISFLSKCLYYKNLIRGSYYFQLLKNVCYTCMYTHM